MIPYSVQVVIPMFTGAPEDVITNTFHVAGEDTTTAEEAAIQLSDPAIANGPSLARFYRAVYGITASGLVPWMNWTGAYLKVFNMTDPTPRVPAIGLMGWPVAGTGAAQNMPTEVAACLSYRSAYISGVPTARARNRIFLGAILAGNLTAGSASAFPTLSSTWRSTIVNAFVAELEAGSDFWQLCQRSDAGGVSTYAPIVAVSMDNSPDSQRRRTVNPSGQNADTAGPWGAVWPPDGV